MQSVKPRAFLKWAGGKQSLAASLLQFFPSEYRTYYEPFLGGGSVFFNLEPKRAILCDDNQWLINTYRALKADWISVAEKLETIQNTKSEFLRIRALNQNSLDEAEQAANLIFLNKTCFRGLFRVNKKGQFNVPYGDYDRRYFDPEELAANAKLLQNVELRIGDFEKGIDGITADDFVYFDSPYYKVGGYSDFNRYTSSKFNVPEHIRLAALCNELDARHVRWALSNSDTDFIRSLYSSYTIRTVDARREINLNSKKRNIKELVITNYQTD